MIPEWVEKSSEGCTKKIYLPDDEVNFNFTERFIVLQTEYEQRMGEDELVNERQDYTGLPLRSWNMGIKY